MNGFQFLPLSLATLLLQPVQAQEPVATAEPSAHAQQGQAVDRAHDPSPPHALARTAQDPRLQWSPCPEFMPQGCAIAVLHGDPGQDNADVLFRVPAGAQIPLHWHTSAERMVLVEGDLQVTYVGQDPVDLRPGTYAYGPAKLAHAGRCGDAGACTLFIAFEQPVDAFPGNPPQ